MFCALNGIGTFFAMGALDLGAEAKIFVAWNAVAWNAVAWNAFAWNAIAWNAVAWNAVAWNVVVMMLTEIVEVGWVGGDALHNVLLEADKAHLLLHSLRFPDRLLPHLCLGECHQAPSHPNE